jgi:hypothetical protein
MPDMTLTRFWDIIHSAEKNPDKLALLLNTLTRREMWLFDEIFDLEYHQILQGTQRSQLVPLYPDDLTPFADLAYQIFMKRCFSDDEKGRAAYPDAVITDWTWDIIERAEKNKGKLRALLMELNQTELYQFDSEFETAAGVLDNDQFMPTPELAHTEDGLLELSHWIVTQGKAYYLSIWENPERFPHDLRPHGFFYGEAEEVFEEKFGKDMWYFNPFTGSFIR